MTIDTNAIKDAVLIFGDLAQQFIALTLKDSTRLISEIEQALNDNNPQAAGEAAHSLKSIMKQIDAQPVADYALKIEKAGKDGDVAACKQEWPPLQENYAIVREYLKTLTA